MPCPSFTQTQGIEPSPHNSTEDYAMAMFDSMSHISDMLLFLASMEIVLGADKSLDRFDAWIKDWWKKTPYKDYKTVKASLIAESAVRN